MLKKTTLYWYYSRAEAIKQQDVVGMLNILGIADWHGSDLRSSRSGFRLDGMNLRVLSYRITRSSAALLKCLSSKAIFCVAASDQERDLWKSTIEKELRARKGASLMERDLTMRDSEKKSGPADSFSVMRSSFLTDSPSYYLDLQTNAFKDLRRKAISSVSRSMCLESSLARRSSTALLSGTESSSFQVRLQHGMRSLHSWKSRSPGRELCYQRSSSASRDLG